MINTIYQLDVNINTPIMECVMNVSEGVNESTIQAIAAAISHIPQQYLLHTDIGTSANRTVYTFAGEPQAVCDAAFEAIKIASERIDMRGQIGAHPRIGAVDVCPFVPLHLMSINDANAYINQLAQRVAAEIEIPVYLYEHSAEKVYRKDLPQIRKGQYEGIMSKMQDKDWFPDWSPKNWDDTKIAKSGPVTMGVRNILVAYNISLATTNEVIAHRIAQKIRTSGFWETKADGTKVKTKGLLSELRAIGWYMQSFGSAQVSMNLLDYTKTSPLKVWQTMLQLCEAEDVSILGSELIGLIPKACLIEAGQYLAEDIDDEKELIQLGASYFKLDAIKPFDIDTNVLEYNLRKHYKC